jgi:hypothetical protein
MVKAALKNPYAVIVLALAILVIGVTAIYRLPTDILPTFKTPAVQILTLYPGMPAEVMERDITSRLERWTGQANGIARQESKSMLGVSEDIDPNTAMSRVTSLAMSDLYYLPPGTIPPMVMPFDPTATIPLALISVSSPTFDETKLYDVAYFDLRNRLQGIGGVIAPAVYGGKLRRILASRPATRSSATLIIKSTPTAWRRRLRRSTIFRSVSALARRCSCATWRRSRTRIKSSKTSSALTASGRCTYRSIVSPARTPSPWSRASAPRSSRFWNASRASTWTS